MDVTNPTKEGKGKRFLISKVRRSCPRVSMICKRTGLIRNTYIIGRSLIVPHVVNLLLLFLFLKKHNATSIVPQAAYLMV